MTRRSARADDRRARFWRPAGLAWGGTCLAALAVGLFPGLVVLQDGPAAAPLPALRAMAVAQAGFLLTVYPLVLARRRRRASATPSPTAPAAAPRPAFAFRQPRPAERIEHREIALTRLPAAAPPPARGYLAACAIEGAALLLVAVPFWAVGAYFGDAVTADATRVAILAVGWLVAAWGLGLLASRGAGWASLVLLLTVLAVLGGPLAVYLAAEFLPGRPAAWLWNLTPPLLAWSAAGSRLGTPWPSPAWAAVLWPASGLAATLLHVVLGRPASAADA